VTNQLSFASVYDYGADAILLPVTLRVGSEIVRVDAYLDTGSTFCVFKRELAAALGLVLESGTPLGISTVTGAFMTFGHALTVETLGYTFDSTIYFASHEGLPRNVLGRRGWLDLVRLGLIQYEGKLYISRYDEE